LISTRAIEDLVVGSAADVLDESGGLLRPLFGGHDGELHGDAEPVLEPGISAAKGAEIRSANNDDIDIPRGSARLSVEASRPRPNDDRSVDARHVGEFFRDLVCRTVRAAKDLYQGLVVGALAVGGHESGVAGAAFAQQAGLHQPVHFAQDVGLGDSGYGSKGCDGLLPLRCQQEPGEDPGLRIGAEDR